MIRRPPRSTRVRSSAASDVYKRQAVPCGTFHVKHHSGWRRRRGGRASQSPFTGLVWPAALGGSARPDPRSSAASARWDTSSAPRAAVPPVRRGGIGAVADAPTERAWGGHAVSAASPVTGPWSGAGLDAMPPALVFHVKHPRQSDARVQNQPEPVSYTHLT